MIRFIFLCMAVVALSIVAIGAQYMMGDMKSAETSVMARNAAPEDVATDSVAAMDETFSPESLNQIETSAGAMVDDGADAGFGAGFTNTAPKALGDDAPVETAPLSAFESPAN